MGHDHGRRGGAGDHDPVQQPAQGQVAPGKGNLVQRRYAQGMPGGRPTPTQRRYGGMAAPAGQRTAAPVQAKSADDEAGQSEARQQADEPMIQLSSAGLDFPEQQVGTRSEVQVVRVVNQGDAPLAVEEITAAFGDLDLFEIYPPALPATVPPAGSVPIGVAFRPKEAGQQEALVYVISGSHHAELTLRGHGTQSTGEGQSTVGRNNKSLGEDVASIIGGQPLDGRTRPSTKSVRIRQIGQRLGLVFEAFESGMGRAKPLIEAVPEPKGRNWSGFLLRLAIEAALVGAAGPVGSIVGRLTLARLANATGLADSLARATRSAVKMTMQEALAAMGVVRALEQQEGLSSDGPDPKPIFFQEAEVALKAAKGNALDNLVQNVEPVLAEADITYLDELYKTFEGLSTSQAIINAQVTSTVEQWINFLARWDHGTWGPEQNLDTLGMKAHGWASGILRVSVENVGEWWEPNIQVGGISIDGMTDETRAHLRTHVKQVGDLNVTKFIDFRGHLSPSIKEARPDGAIHTGGPIPMTHTQPTPNTVASMIIQHMDGSLSLERTNEAGKLWLAYHSNGFYGSCSPDQAPRSPEEGAQQLLAVVDVMPLTTLK